MSAENVALVRRGYEAWARGDLEAVGQLLAPNVKWHGGDSDAPGACRDRAQALRIMRRRPLRDIRVVDVIDAGEQVVTITQPPARGGLIPPPRANVTTIEDGQVTEMVGYESPDEALAAAGLSRPPSPLPSA